MAFQRLRNWLRRREAYHHNAATAYLHDESRFRCLLDCERMRSDRSRSKFSLVVFTFADDEEGCKRFRRFAEYLQPRIRATDHAGFFGPQKIAIILWDTGEVGAWKFVDSVTTSTAAPKADRCDVYSYPTHEVPPSDGNPGSGLRTVTGIAELLEEVSRETGTSRPAQPLELLFVQKLPLWKRVLDVVGAAGGLVVLSPLLACVAAAVKLTSRGPILFHQQRDGLGGRPFTIYKFRTMVVDAEARKATLRTQSEQDGPAFKIKHDPRITPIGRFLRKSCLDELPQLWNVLKGDMTLVGPRPLDVKESQHIGGWQRRRLEVTPGLTCIWQVHGKSKVPFTEWMRMDIRYMRARSLLRDLRLVFETLVSVMLHRASH